VVQTRGDEEYLHPLPLWRAYGQCVARARRCRAAPARPPKRLPNDSVCGVFGGLLGARMPFQPGLPKRGSPLARCAGPRKRGRAPAGCRRRLRGLRWARADARAVRRRRAVHRRETSLRALWPGAGPRFSREARARIAPALLERIRRGPRRPCCACRQT